MSFHAKVKQTSSSGCRKRKPPQDGSVEKRRKMDPCMIQQCFGLLDELKNHPVAGKLFNQTYDDHNNPDYDTVTRNPMDLGIIKFNLENNTYFRIQEFQADLSLAFYNAMLYIDRPLSNVLKMAEEVNGIFRERWKTLKENCPDQENLMVGKGEVSSVRSNSNLSKSEEKIEVPKPKQNRVRKLARKNLRNGVTGNGGSGRAQGSIRNVKPRPPLSRSAGKCSSCGCIKSQCNLQSDLNHASYGEGVAIGGPIKKRQKMDRCMTRQCFALLKELKKHPVAGRLFNIQTLDDQELNGILHARWKSLKDYWQDNPENLKVSRVRSNSSDEVEVPKPRQNCVRKLARKGMISNCISRSISDAEPPSSQGAFKCNSYGSIECQCKESNHASSRSNATSERSMGGKSVSNASNKLDCQCECRVAISQSDRDCASDNVCLSSRLTIPATVTDQAYGEVLITAPNPTIDVQMSPKKALRAAMLKCRFADTISKAQQILINGDKADPVKIQQEKEKLERRLCEEKAKVEDCIRAVEAAAKTMRDREREAARIALQKMGNSAGIELNLETQKELEILSGCSLSDPNPLHRLGLFFKDEYSEDEIEGKDEADLYEDIEEGEIVS